MLISLSPPFVRPTFYIIYKKKTAEGYQSIPYMVSLSSAMMLLYYGLLKTNANLIISINGIGCAIEVVYLVLYIIYAPKREKVISCYLQIMKKLNSNRFVSHQFGNEKFFELSGFHCEMDNPIQPWGLLLDHGAHQFIYKKVPTCDCHGVDLCCLQCCCICFSFKHHGL